MFQQNRGQKVEKRTLAVIIILITIVLAAIWLKYLLILPEIIQQVSQAETRKKLDNIPSNLLSLLEDSDAEVRLNAGLSLKRIQTFYRNSVNNKAVICTSGGSSYSLSSLDFKRFTTSSLPKGRCWEISMRFNERLRQEEVRNEQTLLNRSFPWLNNIFKNINLTPNKTRGKLYSSLPDMATGSLIVNKSIPFLLKYLEDTNQDVIYLSAESLGNLQATESITKLIPILENNQLGLARLGAISALTKIYIGNIEKLDESKISVDQAHRDFNQILFFLGGSGIAILVLLLLMLQNLRQLQGITWVGYLNFYFPEEVVAELAALRAQLTQTQKSTWLIRYILFYEVLTLIWAFYIQITIDNFWLPSSDRRIDD